MKNKTITRRSFLQAGCALGASALISGLFPLQGMASALPFSGQETQVLMGTFVTLTAHGVDEPTVRKGFAAAFVEIQRLIGIFDRFSSHSALGMLNAQGSLNAAPHELQRVLGVAQRVHYEGSVLFNPAVKPLVDLFSSHAIKTLHMQVAREKIEEAMHLADMQAVAVTGDSITLAKPGMGLTLDGIAKGTIVDAASQVLLAHGVHTHMVDASGDIRAQGAGRTSKGWRIAITDPLGKAKDVVQLTDACIASSGGYEQFFTASKAKNHLVNPLTAESPHLNAAHVIAKDAEQADALATALILLPPHEGLALTAKFAGTACLLYGKKGERYASPEWRRYAV